MGSATEQQTTPAASLETIFKALAVGDLMKFQAYFGRMRNAYPQEMAKVCIRYLGNYALDEAGQRITFWLTNVPKYTELLMDPAVMTESEAKHAAKIMHGFDRHFSSRMVESFQDGLSVEALMRLISILQAIGDGGPIIPRLLALTNHPDERLRSKAVKALCELRPNYGLVKRQLESEDARVRANAVEALWHVPSEDVRDIFRIARNDPNHRVAVNALLGLYYQTDAAALDDLLRMAAHSSRDFRAAAMWAVTLLKDQKSIPGLQKLAENGLDGVVRHKANLLLAELVPAVATEAERTKIEEPVQVVEAPVQTVAAPQVAEPRPEVEPAFTTPTFRTF